ncbi:DUF4430 domain-containing protein [Paraclostridium sordellii]|uniref:DUF4430 domain-containing protein n=1 Tax=Paraclostridium sordellii TaxID=1505 RepID=UPI0030D41D1D
MKKHNKFMKMLLTMVLTISIIIGNLPIAFATGKTNKPAGYVTIAVEKFTLGLGYIKEPIKVPFYEDDNGANLITRILGEGNYKNTGSVESSFYLSRVKDNDSRAVNIPQFILNHAGDIGSRKQENWLGEFDYTGMSGWMYGVNNVLPNYGLSDYYPEDGDVIRFQFTVHGYGADLGQDQGWGNPPYIELTNKDALTAKIGEINSLSNKAELLSDPNIKKAYDDAYKILENCESTQNEIDNSLSKLNEVLNQEPEVPDQTNPEDTNTPEVSIPDISVSNAIEQTGGYIHNKIKNPKFGSEWNILGLARGGYNVSKSYFEGYYEDVVNYLKENNGELHSTKYTEYSRTILALTAIGKDVTDVGGYNLLKPLADFNKVKYQGINGPIWALIALDTNDYEIPKVEGVEVQTTRDMLLDFILEAALPNGGWALSGTQPDPDMTAMALQSLAKYKDESRVKPYIDKALEVLSKIQKSDGGYDSWGTSNSESIDQVIVALTALGIDPKTDKRFIKEDGNWTISALMKFYVEGGGFKHTLNDKRPNGMATEQGMYALVAYERFVKGKTNLYDMTDVFKKQPDETPKEGEVIMVAPQKISNKKGTEFDITLKAGDWPKGEYKLLDSIINIPSSVEIKGVGESKNLIGGLPDFGVSDSKLRLVYTNTDLANIEFTAGDMITIHCKLNQDVNESLNFKVESLNLKSSSDSTIKLNVDKASSSIEISDDGGVNPGPDPDPGPDPGPNPNPDPDQKPELAQVKILYKGDGTDLIPSDKQAVAISFLNVKDNNKVMYKEKTKLYYSKEFSEKLSNTTYVALIDENITKGELLNIENYKFDNKAKAEIINFGDIDNDEAISAQDALNTLTSWLRKTDAPNNKETITINVTGDSKIDTSDTLSIIEKYINGKEFKVLSK